MSAIGDIWSGCEGVFEPMARRALTEVDVQPLDRRHFRQALAQLREHVPPAYLPFATFDGSPLALHLFPGRALNKSPIVYVGIGSRSPQFVCNELQSLPVGIWLWVAAYYKHRPDALRDATSKLSDSIPNARRVPDALWTILAQAPEGEPTWWGSRPEQATREAWQVGDVGHPFALLSDIDDENADHALEQLQAVTDNEDHPAPQVLSARIAAHLELGRPTERTAVLALLSSEAWLGGEPAFIADWLSAEDGLGEWSRALRAAAGLLRGTPFERLESHPNTYSGSDPEGPSLLAAVAGDFAARADPAGEVKQLRNSAFVSLFTTRAYDSAACDALANACDRSTPGSPAATLARAYGEVTSKEA
jgi:hypothetical protein